MYVCLGGNILINAGALLAVKYNAAVGGGPMRGGGIYIENEVSILNVSGQTTRVTVERNTAKVGGGILLQACGGNCFLIERGAVLEIRNNTANKSGGLSMNSGSIAMVTGASSQLLVENNAAVEAGGGVGEQDGVGWAGWFVG